MQITITLTGKLKTVSVSMKYNIAMSYIDNCKELQENILKDAMVSCEQCGAKNLDEILVMNENELRCENCINAMQEAIEEDEERARIN